MMRIMLCDDIKSIREYFEKIINQQEDMEVIYGASSGQEAVEYLAGAGELPDIILMDIQMEDEKAGIMGLPGPMPFWFSRAASIWRKGTEET